MEQEGDSIRIRQMAVAEHVRRMGVGRELIQRLEAIAIRSGYSKAMMHARCQAQGFYEKLGYTVVSGVFLELDIPHVIMKKTLKAGVPD